MQNQGLCLEFSFESSGIISSEKAIGYPLNLVVLGGGSWGVERGREVGLIMVEKRKKKNKRKSKDVQIQSEIIYSTTKVRGH